jgi:CRP-like cAMP-binding protein
LNRRFGKPRDVDKIWLMLTLKDLLRTSIWTRELSAEELRTVRSAMTERAVAARGYVCRKGEAVDHWFGIIEGLVKLSSDSRAGRSVTFTGVTAGGWFGEGSLLKDEPRRYDAIALRDTCAACLPRATFLWLMERSIAFNRFLVNQLNERLSQLIAMLEFDRTLDRDTRVARCISALFNPFLYPGTGARLQISQEEIGHLCGLSRQHVNQALHVLEKQRLLRVDFRGITVLDLGGLQSFEAGRTTPVVSSHALHAKSGKKITDGKPA